MDRLNIDCVRDMLLLIENKLRYRNSGKVEQVHLKHVFHQLDNYTNDELCEAAKYLAESKLVTYSNYKTVHVARMYYCNGITPLGHKFIEEIRNDTFWHKVKAKILPYLAKGIDFVIQILPTLC